MGGTQDASVFGLGLPRRGANFRPLSPLDFLAWCEDVFPHRTGVIYGQTRYTYGELGARCRRLASVLKGLGVGQQDLGLAVLEDERDRGGVQPRVERVQDGP